MPIKLTKEGLRGMFPAAPQAVIDAFVAKQHILAKAGITLTKQRLAWCFANVEHESNGFSIANLTENIYYTHGRMAEVWPNRFNSAGDVAHRFGTQPGWQLRAFNEIYGNRMGNRPGTADGSTFIGRGGPQWTGREGYEALARILPTLNPAIPKMTAEQAIAYAVKPEFQPEVCTAFWVWKKLNGFADRGDWLGLVKAWNGGTNGMADRRARLAGNDPHIQRLEMVASVSSEVDKLPGQPKPPKPPATTNEKAATTTGGAVVVGGAAAAGAGWFWESYLAAGLTFGIIAMLATTAFVIWRRR
jgi:predicted chitinase